MSTTKQFRTQIGGYNKEDVNRYIKESDIKTSEKIEELNHTIAQLREQLLTANEEKNNALKSHDDLVCKINDLEKCAEEKNAEITSLRDTLNAEKESCETLKSQYTELDSKYHDSAIKISTLNEELSAKKDECASLLTANAELTNAYDSLTLDLNNFRAEIEAKEKEDSDITNKDSTAYKLHMYNKISSQLGDILINANRTSDEILNSAKNEAEKIKQETSEECEKLKSECNANIEQIKKSAEEEAAFIRGKLSATANTLLKSVSDDLHTSIDNCIREINSCISDMQYEVKTLSTKIIGRSNEMNERINYYQSCAYDGIEEKLNDIEDVYHDGNN